ncbi:YdcF family protein [Mycolicibacterium arabiense]|nr:YdcF family protein [Mycolicibacterium arabiense]
MSWRRRWLTAVQASILVVVVIAVDVSVSGFLVFANARTDDLRQADAIIVLGGEHDGREDYGISLAREGWAPTVVISNPYDDWDPVMKRVCRPAADVEVICARPDPLTTRGEAVLMQRLALERNWSTIIVVSWRYHLPRARLVFDQCFSDRPGSTVMVAVPRRYRYSLFRWEFVFAYQWAGLAKALAQGECS